MKNNPQKIKTVEMVSENIGNDNLQKLRSVFPQFVKDGQIDFDSLQAFLKKEGILSGEEKYGLSWAGKSSAFQAIRMPATGTLMPQPDESKDWDMTENLFIEGDNLEVLKLLQKNYANPGKVKIIYLDPPYNTGKDFIYKDNFTQNVSDYYNQTGQSKDGIKLTSNPESSGRYHSDWLTMMYSRLFLARNLLKDDGVIFVSIDDNEVANLRMVMDEIFGEENFIETYIWESTFRPDNSSSIERENAQYVICYARNKNAIKGFSGQGRKTEGLPSLTKSSMNISVLSFKADIVKTNLKDGIYLPRKTDSEYELLNKVKVKNGIITTPFKLAGRVIWSQDYLDAQLADGTEIIIKGESFVPYSHKKNESSLAPTTLIPSDEVGDVLAARAEINQLFNLPVFSFPKPTSLVNYLLNFRDAEEGEIILDFFAGSGTTAHAVMEQNLKGKGIRKWILVQLPEELDKKNRDEKVPFEFLKSIKKPINIAEICKERIRRAGAKIGKGDIGFKAFKLSPSNYRRWNTLTDEDDEQALLKQSKLFIEKPLVDKYDEISVVYEILLKEGFNLGAKITRTRPSVKDKKHKDLSIWRIVDGDKKMIVSFADKLTKEQIESLELPQDIIFVCFDNALDDTTKVNIMRNLTVKVI